MLSGPGSFQENETNTIKFQEIPSHVLNKGFFFAVYYFKDFNLFLVCHYFTYKARYTNSAMEIPEFPIAPEVALELLMAANFLDC
jgi:transcription elongation factor B subunit 1